MLNSQITDIIETICPLDGQEPWDNSGWQTGNPAGECTGALICVDVTEEILDEAARLGCNLVITHHPLLFHATRRLTGRDRVERCVAKSFATGISVYSAHTSADCARQGVSVEIARIIGLENIAPLTPSGLGATGDLTQPMHWRQFIASVKQQLGNPTVRVSQPPTPDHTISRVAICGGSGGDLMPAAIAAGTQILVTADCKHNQFLDHTSQAMLVDAGHFETEQCTKEIFYRAITEKIPNFAVWKSAVEKNPVLYL